MHPLTRSLAVLLLVAVVACDKPAPAALTPAARRAASSTVQLPAVSAPAPAARTSAPVAEVTVYVTRTGTKYHRAECSYLAKSSTAMSLADAKKRHSACSRCRPPT